MNKKKSNKKTGIILILLIVGLVGTLLANVLVSNAPIARNAEKAQMSPNGSVSSTAEEVIYTVMTQEVERGSLENYLKFNGDVIAETTVEIYPDTTGELTKLNVSLGSYVRKGQVIAEVDPSLPGQKYVASPVKSTINGTITDLPYKVGATISSPQVPLAAVGDLKSLQVQSYISEKDIASVKLNQKGFISFEAYPGESFPATVTEISPVLDRNSRTLEIKMTLDGRDSRIKSGMFGSVYLITETLDDALIIPSNSILTSDEGPYVYLVNSELAAEKRLVETGLSIDGKTVILGGLDDSEELVVLGQTMVQPGSSLKINS